MLFTARSRKRPRPIADAVVIFVRFFVNLDMVVEIKKGDSTEKIEHEMSRISARNKEQKRERLAKFLGILKLQEDAVTIQRKWRDEW